MGHLNTVTLTVLLVCLDSCRSNTNHGALQWKKERSSASKPVPNQADLLEVALHKLKQTASFQNSETPSHDVIQSEHDVIDDADKLHILHKEHERKTRLVNEHEPKGREKVASEKRKEATSHGEILTEDGLNNSESEVQTVQRKDENSKKKDKHLLSNPTYKFFLIAILVFSGVGVFIAISVAIVYLVKRIKDEGRRRNTIEMDDKGHLGLYYYQCSDSSNYSDMGSTYTSHSHLSDDVNRYGAQDNVTSPFSEDDSPYTGGHMASYNGNVMQPLPGKSWTTRVQPDTPTNTDQAQQYGTFYSLNRSSSADNKRDISKMVEDYNWNTTLTSDKHGLLNVVQENKRPKSY